jgi:hypothetical protein
MFEYFYHEIIKKTVVAFGTLFNKIKIQKKDKSGKILSIIDVPIAYGPTQKFLSRLEQSPDLNRPFQITLPRMSFEITGINYDPKRKTTITQTFISTDKLNNLKSKKAFMPVPYDVEFELSIMTKHNDDMLEIIEQILPYFQPSYNITIDLLESIGEKRDIPIILNSISMQDDYEGDFSTRRSLIYTLKFTTKTYLFGPISDNDISSEIIKKVSIGFVSGDKSRVPSRDLTYTVEPKAIKSYTNNIATTISNDVQITDNEIKVENSNQIPENSYITINNETILVTSKFNNTLKVERGKYNTSKVFHVSGSNVEVITKDDDDLIEIGDDFGFSESF